MAQMTLRADRYVTNGADGSHHFVMAEIRAGRQAALDDRVEVDLGVALDRSGSMCGSKLALAQAGVATSLRMLRDSDRFSLVTFNNEHEVTVASSFATDELKDDAFLALERIEARGGTDLFGGYLRSAHQVGRDMRENRLTRVLLLTDGQANHGVVDEDEIVGHVEQLRLRGLITSTIGVGIDFNESLLQRMAAAGGGNSYYVEQAQQLPDVLSGEVGDTLEVTERNVVLEVRVPQGIRVVPLDSSRLTMGPGGLRVALGDLVSEQVVRVVFEVFIPGPSVLAAPALDFVLERADALPIEERITFRHGYPMLLDGQPRDREVLKHVYPVFAARARRLALEHNARYDYAASQATLEAAWRRLHELAQGDPVASPFVEALRADAERYGRAFDKREAKRRYYEAEHQLRDRDPRGRPRRGE